MLKGFMVQQYSLYIEPRALYLSVYPSCDMICNLNARKPNLNQTPSVHLANKENWMEN